MFAHIACGAGLGVAESADAPIVFPQQCIGPVGDCPGNVGISRSAVGRIVFDAAAVRRIVRRGDDNAVG